MRPLVSVIIPCYNSEKYLTETVESVFNQIFHDYEIILINDGSVDSTQKIIESFGKSVRSESIPQSGVSVARNRGTMISTGKFVQYLDSDDLLRPHALGERVDALINADADVAYSDWQKLEKNAHGIFYRGTIVSRKIEDINTDPQIALFTDFWAPPGALMYSRKIVEAIGGWNESLPIIQDARFLLDAALNGAKFVHVPGVGMDYRITHHGSLSTKDPVAFLRDALLNTRQIHAIWERRGILSDRHTKAILQSYDYVAKLSFGKDKEMFNEACCCIHKFNLDKYQIFSKNFNFSRKILGYKRARWVGHWYGKFFQPRRAAHQSLKAAIESY